MTSSTVPGPVASRACDPLVVLGELTQFHAALNLGAERGE